MLDSPSQPAALYVRPPRRFEFLSTLSPISRSRDRACIVRSLIDSSELDNQCTVVEARKATVEELALAHSHRYLNLLASIDRHLSPDSACCRDSSEEESDCEMFESTGDDIAEQLEEAGLVDDCPAFTGMWEMARYTVGGAVLAAEHLVRGSASVACWFEGGRHHAASDSAHGFCYVNDIVVACKILLLCPRINRVFYVDIDVHHGDGVENAFLFTNTVATLSFHLCETGFYPNTPRQVFATKSATKSTAIRIPLRRGINNEMYARTFTACVEKVYAHYRPDAIVLQCGVDGASGDPLGGFNLTGEAYVRCVERILSYDKPTLILGGGGYNAPNAARIWTDVLECCILERAKPSRRSAEGRGQERTREICTTDDFFDRYGPTFSRDVQAQRMNNENSDEEINNLIQQLEQGLR